MYKLGVNSHYRFRQVKTKSGSTAIQIGFYKKDRKFKLIKHLGSSSTPKKIDELIEIAQEYIRSNSPQLKLNFNPQSDEIMFTRGIQMQSKSLEVAYKYINNTYSKLGFDKLESNILKHFVLIRILEPASKIKSIELLKKYFGIEYKKTTVFRKLLLATSLKDSAVGIAISYARKHFGFDFSLVFYDVTTLYFETNEHDEFRLNGFSKDNKINQPQILVGLMVNNTGFPVYYDTFRGNTFEGHTIIPAISAIKTKYKIKKLTVVADAGMLSQDNLSALEEAKIDYVVGARIKKLNINQVREIANRLDKTNSKSIRQDNVIYQYSIKRARKDKADNDKQVKKAEYLLNHPTQINRRSSFLLPTGKSTFNLNQEIIDKYRLLEGIKGYKTNINKISNKLLIDRYKDLWRIEQSFRIAKSDLQARPIYHRKQDPINYHLLIVFMALCLSRIMEQEKQQSIKKIVEELKDVWTITIKDEISGNQLKFNTH